MFGSRCSNLSLELSVSLLWTPTSQLQFPHVETSQELQIYVLPYSKTVERASASLKCQAKSDSLFYVKCPSFSESLWSGKGTLCLIGPDHMPIPSTEIANWLLESTIH